MHVQRRGRVGGRQQMGRLAFVYTLRARIPNSANVRRVLSSSTLAQPDYIYVNVGILKIIIVVYILF
jgi:hypothetical protein